MNAIMKHGSRDYWELVKKALQERLETTYLNSLQLF